MQQDHLLLVNEVPGMNALSQSQCTELLLMSEKDTFASLDVPYIYYLRGFQI